MLTYADVCWKYCDVENSELKRALLKVLTYADAR
jgi:hypothetical protein